MALSTGFETPVTRHYIDTRPYLAGLSPAQAKQVALPLLNYLPMNLQESIGRYMRAEDRFMSLASALLKYQFIHRSAKLPWSQVEISRTPKPHARPFWDPPLAWHGQGFKGLDFNVSHQAGIVVLLGCRTPTRPVVTSAVETPFGEEEDDYSTIDPNPEPANTSVSVGVDVACTREPRRTPDLTTQAKLDAWVDTFAEMFSERDRQEMKDDPQTSTQRADSDAKISWSWQSNKLEAKARRFYTSWALKEAYIKMVGEGLLADWLQDLEFVNVVPPARGQRFTAQEAGMKVVFEDEDITNSINTELEGLDNDFILATMMRGITEQVSGDSSAWINIDIGKDIRPCAEGRCSCLTAS